MAQSMLVSIKMDRDQCLECALIKMVSYITDNLPWVLKTGGEYMKTQKQVINILATGSKTEKMVLEGNRLYPLYMRAVT